MSIVGLDGCCLMLPAFDKGHVFLEVFLKTGTTRCDIQYESTLLKKQSDDFGISVLYEDPLCFRL